MNQSLKFFLMLLYTALVASCSSKAKQEVDWDAVLYNMETLSTLAASCLEQKARQSESCINFVRHYEADGADHVELLSDNLPELLNNDLDAALITTEQILVITTAVVFMGGYDQPPPASRHQN
ncbi:MAG: hypothetical protein KJ556_12030 [Gammaproteobacteria bacterium]|nr:hypothetical protein [Gammaproteobacteria bacterium]MBU2059897.1 hypothetical protein [Gammaproteobacteria bacterium]MBU2175848.1 hypothetical protein [Gammaproteobacteria bacterium]MBU2247671.1 hypothetical protein [Gammaproteobacteria bacterium]MBU2346470.1 hypothetical protein [Gammaproteobacteria bacterium]